MLNKFDFYKEQYYKELDRKNDISNSLTIPIGFISALVAGLFYSMTTFDYEIKLALTVSFIVLLSIAVIFLSISIFHLIKAFSNFHNGYNYQYLIDTDDLKNYYEGLKNYYAQQSTIPDNSDGDFEDYVLTEYIKNTGVNQKNNKLKIYHRFLCHKFMIWAFLTICTMIVIFGIDFGYKNTKTKIQKVDIDSILNINLQTKQNQLFIDSLILKLTKMEETVNVVNVVKPKPPKSQIIKEGADPTKKTTIDAPKNPNQ